jgi:hypothetical protein
LHAARGKDWEEIAEECIEDNAYAITRAQQMAAKINEQFPDAPQINWRDLVALPMPEGMTMAMQDPAAVAAQEDAANAEQEAPKKPQAKAKKKTQPQASKDFDELKITRDDDGKFGTGGGGDNATSDDVDHAKNASLLANRFSELKAPEYKPFAFETPQGIQKLADENPDTDLGAAISDQVTQAYIKQMAAKVELEMPDHAWATGFDADADYEEIHDIVYKLRFPREPDEFWKNGELDTAVATKWASTQSPKIWSKIDAAVRKFATPDKIKKRLMQAGEYEELDETTHGKTER